MEKVGATAREYGVEILGPEVSGVQVDTAPVQGSSPTAELTLGPGLATRQKTLSHLWQEGNKLTLKGGFMEMMHWYNPLTMEEEEVSAPMSDPLAIEILSGHQDSDRFIEEYRRRRGMQTDVVKALIFTGEMFYREHRRGQPPG